MTMLEFCGGEVGARSDGGGVVRTVMRDLVNGARFGRP